MEPIVYDCSICGHVFTSGEIMYTVRTPDKACICCKPCQEAAREHATKQGIPNITVPYISVKALEELTKERRR